MRSWTHSHLLGGILAIAVIVAACSSPEAFPEEEQNYLIETYSEFCWDWATTQINSSDVLWDWEECTIDYWCRTPDSKPVKHLYDNSKRACQEAMYNSYGRPIADRYYQGTT